MGLAGAVAPRACCGRVWIHPRTTLVERLAAAGLLPVGAPTRASRCVRAAAAVAEVCSSDCAG